MYGERFWTDDLYVLLRKQASRLDEGRTPAPKGRGVSVE